MTEPAAPPAHVATLIAGAGALAPEQLSAVAAVLPGAGAPCWLDEGTAADIPFAPPAGSGAPRWTHAAYAALGHAPVDVVVQPVAHRRKRLLVADMDSTIIDQECIDELADVAGLRDAVAAITERAMRGELDFAASLTARVGLLAGLDVERAARLVAARITVKAGAATLVATMRAHGAETALASGGFTLFVAPVARTVGFDRYDANTLGVVDGRLTGTLDGPVFGREAKRAVLVALRDARGLAPHDTLAVGDGANDLAMLEAAGLGVAFRAKPAVAAVARARIEHADLTALLYLQGYRRAEFVAAPAG